jgi:hypothetical protein
MPSGRLAISTNLTDVTLCAGARLVPKRVSTASSIMSRTSGPLIPLPVTARPGR